MKRRFFFFIPFIVAAAVLLFGGIVMWLWNNILPAVAGLGALTYWQAVGLLVLTRILVGGFRGGPYRERSGWSRGGPRWREKWMNMNAEEREQFRAEWRDRCRRRGEK